MTTSQTQLCDTKLARSSFVIFITLMVILSGVPLGPFGSPVEEASAGTALWTDDITVADSGGYDKQSGYWIISDDETMRAYNHSGGVVWSQAHNNNGNRVDSFDSEDGVAYAANGAGRAKAFDTSTGDVLWDVTIHSDQVYGVAVNGSDLYSASYDQTIKKSYASNGTEQWSYSLSSNGYGAAADDTGVYAGVGSSVMAVDADKTQRWQTSISGNAYQVDEAGGWVFALTYGGDAYKINKSTGNIAWTYSDMAGAVYGTAIKADPKTETVHIGLEKTSGNYQYEVLDFNKTLVDNTTLPGEPHATGYNSSGDTLYGYVGGEGYTQLIDTNESVSSSGGSGNAISGVVRDQNGDPVSNATVKVVGVDHSQIQLENADSLDERADDLLQEARNAKPPSWEKDLDLAGSNGLFGDVSSYYPAVHSKQDWGLSGYTDTPELENPNVQVPAGEPVILSAWDPTERGLTQDGLESDLPGSTVGNAVELTQLDATGDTVRSETIRLNEEYEVRAAGLVAGRHQYAEVELSPGFYQVSVVESDVSYTIVAGNPDEIAAEISKDLLNRESELRQQAKDARQKFQDGKFTATTVTTNQNGSFSVSLPKNVKTVSATAYKVPAGMAPENATRADIREYYNTMNITRSVSDDADPFAVRHHDLTRADANLTAGAELDEPVPAFYLPAGSAETDVPAGKVTLEVYKTDLPTFAEPGITANRSQLREWFLSNLSYSDLPSALQNRWNATNATLQDVRDDLYNVTQANEELRSQVERLLAKQRNTSVEKVREQLKESEKSRELLRQEIAALREIISQQDATVTIPQPEVERSEAAETVSLSWSLPADVHNGNVSVLSHYANGTTRTVGQEYVSVDEATIPGQSTVVRVSEFPLGASDPSSVQFELQAASAEGWGSSEAVVKNPTFDGELPSIDSISVSSVAPGPSENVTVRVSPSESGSWKRLTNVSAIGPDGSTIGTSSISEGRELSFTTNGEGVHTLRLTAETTSGEPVVIPVRVKAVGREVDQSPTLSVKGSPVGEYVLTSGEFERAKVSTEDARQNVQVTAQLPSGDDVPNEIDVHLEELSTPSSSTVSVKLVRGESQESVSQHVPVQIHMKAPTDDVLLWRNGQAVSKNGGKWGKADLQGDQLVLKTYTDSNGHLKISKENDPGLFAEISHGISRVTQSFALVVSFAPDAPSFAWTPTSALATPTPEPLAAGTADAVGPAPDAAVLEEVVA